MKWAVPKLPKTAVTRTGIAHSAGRPRASDPSDSHLKSGRSGTTEAASKRPPSPRFGRRSRAAPQAKKGDPADPCDRDHHHGDDETPCECRRRAVHEQECCHRGDSPASESQLGRAFVCILHAPCARHRERGSGTFRSARAVRPRWRRPGASSAAYPFEPPSPRVVGVESCAAFASRKFRRSGLRVSSIARVIASRAPFGSRRRRACETTTQ